MAKKAVQEADEQQKLQTRYDRKITTTRTTSMRKFVQSPRFNR